MAKLKLTGIEKFVLGLAALILLAGFVLFYTNLSLFETYVHEDGIVEWLTVAGLLAGFFVCLKRFFSLLKYKNWWFLTVTIVLAFMLFMVAGEEISWGQRILGIKSSEFFEKNNLQHETNFHNLVLNGVKINKVVFSIALIAALGIFLIVLPILYQLNKKVKSFIDYSGVVVPRGYQIVSFLLLFIITSLLHHEKNSELLECGAALLFFLIVRYPKNASVFKGTYLYKETR
jgi:hypothetical protein